MKYINKFVFITPMVVLAFLFAIPVDAQTQQTQERLVKCADQSTVYSVDQKAKKAKTFPDVQTFYSYGYEFAQIETIICESGLPYKLAGIVPNKSGEGFRLIKKKGDPSVFQCVHKNSYKVCDKISNEKEAVRLFGPTWSKQVYETNESTLDMLVWHWKKPTSLATASVKK